MIVRAAAPGDAAAISVLLEQLGYRFSASQVSAKLQRLATSDLDAVLVAETGSQITGCASVHALELFHVEGRLGRITALVVDSRHHGRGVGKALVESAERFLVAAGCVKIELTSGDHRIEAHRFYEARGYRQSHKRFLKVLA